MSKPAKLRSKDERKMLRECKDVVKEVERRARLKEMVKKKTQEVTTGIKNVARCANIGLCNPTVIVFKLHPLAVKNTYHSG